MFNQMAKQIYEAWKITCLIDLPRAREDCDVTGDPDITVSRTPRTLSRWRASAASEARDGEAEQAGAGAGEGQDGERRGGKTGSARPPEGSGPGLHGETGNSHRYTHTELLSDIWGGGWWWWWRWRWWWWWRWWFQICADVLCKIQQLLP